MVLATEIMLPPRRNSFGGSDSEKIADKVVKPKSPPANKSHWWFFTSKLRSSDSVGGSNQHIATQKLRESKWFHDNEERLVCAVIEGGFIVELKKEVATSSQDEEDMNPLEEIDIDSHDSTDSSHKDPSKSQYGIIALEMKKSKL